MNNRHAFGLILPLLVLSGCNSEYRSSREHVLWYASPTQEWTEALPVGNGRLGCMLFGNPANERLQLNEESLWGGVNVPNNNPGALAHLPEIRELILDDRIPEAYDLAEEYLSGIPGKTRSYQTLGDIFLRFIDTAEVTGYRRELDLETGIARVSFLREGGMIEYEVFASAPDDVIVISLRSERKGGLDMVIAMLRPQDAEISVTGDRIIMRGQVIDPDEPDKGPAGAHMRFYAYLLPLNHDGTITGRDSVLYFSGGTRLVMVFSAATDYSVINLNFNSSDDPTQRGNEAVSLASHKSLKQLRDRHVSDHSSMFNRVSLSLGEDHFYDTIPTDERLRRFQAGGDDPGLIVNYFQYGRYLLMGSSRGPAQLPANLQGIWNKDINAPWNSDYHTNINLQMNYWPAEVCNLSETVEPLITFMEGLTVPGSVTAREMYGAQGWTMHHTTDVFGKTAVLDGVYWGMFPLGGAWMTLPLWEHFLFTGDTTYLREKAYPIMKGAADFITSFLVEDKEGRLVTVPSYSPENSYIDPASGKEYKLTYSPTMDNQIIREVLRNCQHAADILGIDREWAERLQNTLDRLPSDRVAPNGTIMEWIRDYKEAEPGHRHMSHLFGLHPGTQITSDTPELWAAARKTLERRLMHGGGHTGWSRAWIINFYARLLDGNECYRHLRLLIERSTLPNLFDNHPPFQIDGNFGGTAGIAEMLLQSHNGVVKILPALPDAWPYGHVAGLKARGNFEVGIEWEEGTAKEITVRSLSGAPLILLYHDKKVSMDTEKDKTYRFDKELKWIQ
jgi:alpha-L-fucosidase 2